MSEVAAHIMNADPLLGLHAGGPWFGPQYDGRIGTITHVDNRSPDGAPVVLVDWD